jgi:hypothetical protein
MYRRYPVAWCSDSADARTSNACSASPCSMTATSYCLFLRVPGPIPGGKGNGGIAFMEYRWVWIALGAGISSLCCIAAPPVCHSEHRHHIPRECSQLMRQRQV